MVTKIKPRPTQTKIKHEILKQYLKGWGAIIINGLIDRVKSAKRIDSNFQIHLVYVDSNASSGRYQGELEDYVAGKEPGQVFGSPIIGVQELDALTAWAKNKYNIEIHTNVILIEVEKPVFAELLKTLEIAKLTSRVRFTDNFSNLKNGEIAVLNADSTTLTSKLIAYTQSSHSPKFSLFFLEPV